MDLPLAFENATRDISGDQFQYIHVLNWNISAPTAAFLLHVRGNVDRFELLLREDPDVEEYDLLTVDDDECYCFVAGVGTPDARELWETFKRGSLMTVPPAEWNLDGSYTFTVMGADADVQAAVEGVPSAASIDIESVGGTKVATQSVIGQLSDRQREAVEAGIELGYYDVPRAVTIDDIAGELDCATSTAAEHLRKAESKLIVALIDE